MRIKKNLITIQSPHIWTMIIADADNINKEEGKTYGMKAYYKLLGLGNNDIIKKIHKEVSAIHGVEAVTIDAQKQEMTICTAEEKLSRIEHAAIVIISYITPQIEVQKL